MPKILSSFQRPVPSDILISQSIEPKDIQAIALENNLVGSSLSLSIHL